MFHFGQLIDLVWHQGLFRPLYNLLLVFYAFLGHSMGFGIMGLVLAIRVILLPFSMRQGRAEKRLTALQPELDALRKRYSHDLDRQKKATKELLKENRIGIWGGVLSLAFQFLILAVLYSIFANAILLDNTVELYTFVLPLFEKMNNGSLYINYSFFGWFSLLLPNVWASLIASLIVFIHQSIRPTRGTFTLTSIEKWMVFALPPFTFLVTIVLPSSKAVFIGTSVLFSFILGLFRAAYGKIKKG